MPRQNPEATPQITRRQLIQYSAFAAAGIAVGSDLATPSRAAAVPLGGGGVALARPAGTIDGFSDPTAATAPRLRWWWPNGQVDLDEIAAEVKTAADAGFGGLEISNVHHSVKSGLDVVNYGWGGDHWVAAMETALTAAQQHGIQIDVTLGPSWPAAVPSITPQSDAAMKEVAHGSAIVAPGAQYSDVLPAPIVVAAAGVTDSTLLTVQAAEIVSTGKTTVLRRSSVVDLTGQVANGRIAWTAPAGGGSWVLLAYWQRGTGQVPEGGPHTDPTSYVVDHFSMAGARTLIEYWNAHILTDKAKQLLRKVGGTFFEDSLEIETDATLWTPDFVAQFRARIGYDPLPYLPVLVEVKEKYLYDFDDIVTTRVRDDANQVLSDLYSENHLIALRDWAHANGVDYRVQVYGLQQDSIQQAGIVDIPETESLGAKNVDDYRVLASARDIAGRTLLSCESSAYLNKAYLATWRKDVLFTLAETFCGGVNQQVFHGYPYATAPGAAWPGFAAFSPYNGGDGYSEAWGPRMPVWGHLPAVAAAVSRIQWVLRQGRAQYDVAYYRQKGWAQTGIGAPWATASGIPIGWTHGFLDESSLFQDGASLQSGRFSPRGGAYKAFVIDIDRFRGNEATMSVRAGQRLLELAHAGFPLVLFGDWSKPASTGLRSADVNAQVAAIVAELKSLPNVAAAPGNDDIPIALASLGVTRSVRYANSNLKHIHRVDAGTDFYYLVNAKHNPAKDKLVLIDQSVTLTASSAGAVPYELDAWTGEVRRIPAYSRDGATVTVRVRLQPAQATIVVLAPEGWAKTAKPKATVVTTTADDTTISANGSIFLQSATAGTRTAVLDSGRSVQAVIPALPAPIDLTDWSLTVDDWQPVTVDGTATQHVSHQQQLSALAPWSQLGMADVGGIGDYRSTFDLDASWRPGDGGVRLSLGNVLDTFRVWVNGALVDGVDLTDTDLDISDYVREGANSLRVEVASPLINRLRLVNPTAYGAIAVQDYGLMGPVRVSAFGRARIA